MVMPSVGNCLHLAHVLAGLLNGSDRAWQLRWQHGMVLTMSCQALPPHHNSQSL